MSLPLGKDEEVAGSRCRAVSREAKGRDIDIPVRPDRQPLGAARARGELGEDIDLAAIPSGRGVIKAQQRRERRRADPKSGHEVLPGCAMRASLWRGALWLLFNSREGSFDESSAPSEGAAGAAAISSEPAARSGQA